VFRNGIYLNLKETINEAYIPIKFVQYKYMYLLSRCRNLTAKE